MPATLLTREEGTRIVDNLPDSVGAVLLVVGSEDSELSTETLRSIRQMLPDGWKMGVFHTWT